MKHFMMALLVTGTTLTGSFLVNIPTELFSNKFNSASSSSVPIFGIPSADAQNRQDSRRWGGSNRYGRGSRYVGGYRVRRR
jgi:hypothetical protein